MKNRKGFCFINILLQISLILLLLSFGFIYFKKLIEREELIRAKTEIYEVFTTYGIKAQEKFNAKITSHGNITPSFSIYIFDYNDIAQYRISFYGFDLIKYMQINVYRNINDTTPKYNTILNFHNKWTTTNPKWKEE